MPYLALFSSRIDGSGEWRQLLSDMSDIRGWLERADSELKSQQPAGPYIESVQQQSKAHEVISLFCFFVVFPHDNFKIKIV